jgi:hypothetical protein
MRHLERTRLVLIIGSVLLLFTFSFEHAEAARGRKQREQQQDRASSSNRGLVGGESKTPGPEEGVSEPEAHGLALELLANGEADRRVLVDWVKEHAGRGRSEVECERIVDCVLETEDPLLLLAIFRRESRFNPTARSRKGALGLGQVMPGHVPRLKDRGIIRSKEDLLGIEGNVRAADYVWRMHVEDARGDRNRALSRFGGFRKKSANAYIQKVYASVSDLAALVVQNGKDRLLLADASVNSTTGLEQLPE